MLFSCWLIIVGEASGDLSIGDRLSLKEKSNP
jgi:hypothetical protein